MLRTIRMLTWGLVAALAVAVAVSVAGVRLPGQRGVALPLAAVIGGPFKLAATTASGSVSDVDLKGAPFAIFFGYTFCPDVCPTTLLDLSNAIKQLGPDADRMHYVFVTVDPARDTIEHLKLYLSSFDPHITGTTGTEDEIADITRKYHVIAEKVGTGRDYSINHSASTYLMDAQGHFSGTFDYQEKPEVVVAKLRRLLAGE